MGQDATIVVCRCAYAEVLPAETLSAVLAAVSASSAEVELADDLCELSARRDPRLKRWAETGPLRIAACFPRAVRWLFAAGGASDPSLSLIVGSDNYPDIFVGRLSAENVSQLETQIERSVEYEKLPQDGSSWYHKGTGVASNQGSGIGH